MGLGSKFKFAYVAMISVGVAGCDTTGTIFKDIDVNDGTGYSLGARQRTILVKTGAGPGASDLDGREIVCTEPSPDAMVAVASAFAAQAGASGGGANSASGQGGFSRAFSEAAATIGVRTQTIQLLRDQLFRACEAYMNGAIGRFQYNQVLNNMDRVMVSVLAVDALGASPTAPAVAIGTTATASAQNPSLQEVANQSTGSTANQQTTGGAQPLPGLVSTAANAIDPKIQQVTINRPPEAKHRSEAITRVALKVLERTPTGGVCLGMLADPKIWEIASPEAKQFCRSFLHDSKHAGLKSKRHGH